MPRSLDRLFRPRSIAVVGGGTWCSEAIRQLDSMKFDGAIWPVHPKADTVAGHRCYPSIDLLPAAPDAVFVGVNRLATIDVVSSLSARGAGGAVCFASGFSEAVAEDATGSTLQTQLVTAAGDMPILGPNCYGFINALDGALLWPDQHGCTRVGRGVAILTQSSNIAINLTMQQRALPIAYTVTCGNMAQTSQAEIAAALLDDPRVTAVGLHIEGFGDLRAWESLAQKAWDKGVPLVALKAGASEQAQTAALTHTASLTGSDTGAQAVLDRLGIPRVAALPEFIETLKLLHCRGRLGGTRIASISCSGGEASLIADLAEDTSLTFPNLSNTRHDALREALGSMVALSNPLDYHTYIWRDAAAMTSAWSAMTGDDIDMTFTIVDYPTTDPSDWACATQAALGVHSRTNAPFAVVATLPELMPSDTATELMEGGVVPLFGLREALMATEAAAMLSAPNPQPITQPGSLPATGILSEIEAKLALAQHGLVIPRNALTTAEGAASAAAEMLGPFAVKGVGLAHKSDSGAVRLGIPERDVEQAAREIGTKSVLIEEMINDTVIEILIGVTRDPAHGFVLTLGAGGVLTELLSDTSSLLLPIQPSEIEEALDTLRCAPILHGYRGQPAANISSIVDAVIALQSYVLAHAETVSEVEVNPLLCTPVRAVAVDALIRKA